MSEPGTSEGASVDAPVEVAVEAQERASTLGAAPGTRAGFARDVALVARFEIAEAVRTRLLLVMTLLFVGAGALGAWGFTRILARVESTAASALGAPTTNKPGAVAKQLRDSRSYRDVLRAFTGSEEKATYYAKLPPIAVFFGWVSFLFTPWLFLFTSSETIAAEVSSRSIRYSALRTGRLEFALGKMFGQALIAVAVTALMALTFFGVAWLSLAGFEGEETALALLSHWPRVLVYSLPFLGWAMFGSMVTSSANVARIVALGGAVGLAIVAAIAGGGLLRRGAAGEALADLLELLTPFGHKDGLFYPPGGALVSDAAVCLALTALYFGLGFLVLRRRDI